MKPVETSDLELIERLCTELTKGDRSSFSLFFNRFHILFLRFTQRRVLPGMAAEEVLGDFWLKLLDARIICSYSNRLGASPRAYLLVLLKNHIMDANRKAGKELSRRRTFSSGDDVTDTEFPETAHSDTVDGPPGSHDPEDLVTEAVSLLCQIHPSDALLIQLRLAGHAYQVILSENLLGDQTPGRGTVTQRENALKTRYKRAKMRLRGIIERLCRDKGVFPEDLLGR